MGRVIKLGQLDQTKLMDAIAGAPVLSIGKFTWTITNVIDRRDEALPFVFGHLAKFSPEGHVKTVDKERKSEVDSIAPNLLIASAPFVYLPAFSGIAYMHVWNGIQELLFPKRFKTLIEGAYGDFFVDCSIEPIADYRQFTSKIRALDRITEISAKVNPPNPLFGRLWGSLKKYIEKRNASEVRVQESREDGSGLNTKIVEYIERILGDTSYAPDEEPDISDAALLMAADGYGRGRVTGLTGNDEVVIRTSDTQKSFMAPIEPEPSDLAIKANNHFSKISKERDMGH